MTDITIAGAAILDVLLRPVSEDVFRKGSQAVDGVRLTTGGDAMNESTVLARLGKRPKLITRLGDDDAARLIEARCAKEGIQLDAVYGADDHTSVNAVLVDERGERVFLTDPTGTLRRLKKHDILPKLGSGIFCLASMFVSFDMGLGDMAEVFRAAKSRGMLVCADTTKPKRGETIRDAAGALEAVDVFFANRDEAGMLTRETDPKDMARALTGAGVRTAVLKLGGDGCLVCDEHGLMYVPAAEGIRCVDTTGAGDTFAGAYIARLSEGGTPAECAAYANAAAGQCTEHLGAAAYEADLDRIERDAERILRRT